MVKKRRERPASRNPFKGGVKKDTFKSPGRASTPEVDKLPRVGEALEHMGAQKFQWSFDKVDWGGPYCWSAVSAEKILKEVIPRLKLLEQSNWAEVQSTGSHAIEIENLIQAAQNRIKELYDDQCDSVYSLRIQGKERVFGVKDMAILRILWWDPEHEVCPSKKKHT